MGKLEWEGVFELKSEQGLGSYVSLTKTLYLNETGYTSVRND